LTSEHVATSVRPSEARLSVRHGKRAWLLRGLRILALSAFTLIYAELFVRIVSPQSLMPRYITSTPWGVRGNIPHARYWHHTPEVDVQYRINSQGLRADRDYPFVKPPGTCRIAAFGDSFMMGYELDLKDTFTTRLEQILRARGWRVEVLNFSVSGFGTAEMLRTYTGLARKFDPDVVMFSWDYSDLADNVRSGLYRLRDGTLEEGNPTYVPVEGAQDFLLQNRLYTFIADNSHLYTLIRDRLAVFTKQILLVFREDRKHPDTVVEAEADDNGQLDEGDRQRAEQKQANAALSSAILARAAQQVAADGKDFYLIDIPIRLSRTQFRSTVGDLSDSVRSHIKIIAPLAALSRAARPDLKLYYELGHGHFTPAGAQLLALEAADTLARSPRLAACAAATPAH
jgi:hypothetical protein